MSTDPDHLREEIERTRAELSSDVDALTDRVSPVNVARRQGEKVHETVVAVRERILGGLSGATSTAGSAASSFGEKASALPVAARSKARGTPLAAGLVAFGLGWWASSLVPSSRQEQRFARSARDEAGPLVDEAKAAADAVAQNLQQPAQDAVAAVKDRATEAGATLRDESRSTADDLRADASAAADRYRAADRPFGEAGH